MPQVLVSWVTLAVLIQEEAPAQVTDKWEKIITTLAPEINQARKAKIPDEEAFQKIIATPSTLAYVSVLDPDFISRSGLGKAAIVAGQATNLVEAFRKYNENLDYIFRTVNGDPAKLFKQLVAAKKPHFGRGIARWTLPTTGTHLKRGPGTTAGYWLTGDSARVRITPADQIKAGGPKLITTMRLRPAFRAALMGRLVQAAAVIIKTRYDEDAISDQNDWINDAVQRFVDPALLIAPFTTGGDSHVDYTKNETEQLFLDIKVSVTP